VDLVISSRLVGKNVHELVSPHSGVKVSVLVGNGMVFSSWLPSPEELELLNKGKAVWLVQRGNHIPEMTMAVGDEDFVVPREVLLAKVAGDPVQEAREDLAKDVQQNLFWGKVLVYGAIYAILFAACVIAYRYL
jgi:hypothetical protein